jgi:ABC-type branched-subunit amino acid transport system substrate-binding protein
MSVINRRNFLKGAGVAGIVSLAGCAGDNGDGETTTDTGNGDTGTTQAGGVESRTIKLGLLLPETGDLGQLGQPMVNAGQLAVKTVNDADIPLDVDARTEDTQTQQSAGISAANSLVNAGYPAVVGPASSGINIPVSKQVFIPNGIVGISPSSTALTVTTLDDNDYIYRTAPSDALQGKVLGQIADEELGHQTAATMYVNNDYGQQLSNAFVDAFEGRGGTIQNEVSFEKQQSSYTSRIQQAAGDDPGVIVVIGYPASGVQLFKDYYVDFDADRSMLVTDGLKESTLPNQVGHNMTNVGGSSPLAAGPAKDAFNTAYQEEYDSEPGVFTSQTFDAAAVVMLANAAAGENSGTAVRDQMREVANPGGTEVSPENLPEGIEMAAAGEEIQYVGASSSVDFDDAGDMTAVTYEYFKFQEGGGVETVTEIPFGQ